MTVILFGLAMLAPLTVAGVMFGAPGVLAWVIFALVVMWAVFKNRGQV